MCRRVAFSAFRYTRASSIITDTSADKHGLNKFGETGTPEP